MPTRCPGIGTRSQAEQSVDLDDPDAPVGWRIILRDWAWLDTFVFGGIGLAIPLVFVALVEFYRWVGS